MKNIKIIRKFHNSLKIHSDKLFVHVDTPLNNQMIKFEFNKKNTEIANLIISNYPSQYKKAAVIPLLELGFF